MNYEAQQKWQVKNYKRCASTQMCYVVCGQSWIPAISDPSKGCNGQASPGHRQPSHSFSQKDTEGTVTTASGLTVYIRTNTKTDTLGGPETTPHKRIQSFRTETLLHTPISVGGVCHPRQLSRRYAMAG